MTKGFLLFLLAGIWELARFIAVFLASVATRMQSPLIHLTILWLGGSGLLLAALFFASAYYRDRVQAYMPILRLGVVITALTDLIVIASRAYDPLPDIMNPGMSLALMLVALGVFTVDLVLVGLLLARRTKPRETGTRSEDLPAYDPTEVDES